MPYYRSAYDMDMRKVIDTYAAAQQHIDQSLFNDPLYAVNNPSRPLRMEKWTNS